MIALFCIAILLLTAAVCLSIDCYCDYRRRRKEERHEREWMDE